LLNNPHKVAELAIKDMAEKGYRHLDIAWRHIALLPSEYTIIENNKKEWSLKPMLIDLAYVRKLTKNETIKKVVEEDLKILDDELVEFKNNVFK
jgi:hypothetical protein